MILYNLRSTGEAGQYVITKFDEAFNVETSYLVSRNECACPRAHKDSCRHRQMVRVFEREDGSIDSDMFYCFEDKSWHKITLDDGLETNDEFEATLPIEAALPASAPAEAPVVVPVLPPPTPSAGAALGRRYVRRG